jgi:ATP-binding cassette subfamily B protein
VKSWRTLVSDGDARSSPATPREQLAALGSLGPYLWPKGDGALKLRVVAALVLVVLAKLFSVSVPFVLKMIVDALSKGSAAPKAGALIAAPIALILIYGLVRTGASASGELRDLVFSRVVQRAVRRVSIQALHRLHGLSLRFHLDRQTGGVSRVLERGAAAVEVLLGLTLFNLTPILLEVILVSAILWRLFSPAFAAATVAVIVGYGVFTVSLTQYRVKVRREMNRQDNDANAIAIDSLINYETVKYFGAEHHEIARFDSAKAAYEDSAVRNQATLSALNIGQNLIMSFGLVGVLVMAGLAVAHGRMTIGDFVMVNGYMLQLFIPLNVLGMIYRSLKQSLVDFEQMHRLIGAAPEVQDAPGAQALRQPGGGVVFRDVSFGYDPRRPILRDVSFEVPSGAKVALVGPSGAGKSTLARLLFRFYDVSQGEVVIGGEDIRHVTQESLRAAIGVVPQDTVLFNDTVYYNIAYGRPEATRDEVIEAARLAQLDHFIESLPDGYETRVGERGLKLSGGEKQRVAIARVILKRPKILIFDEATSALDSRTEQGIQDSLRALALGHTSLVIAHRLSTVTDADEILVLDGGVVVERGDHGALLRRGGLYSDMWARQQAARTEDGSNDGVALGERMTAVATAI